MNNVIPYYQQSLGGKTKGRNIENAEQGKDFT